MGSCFPQHRKPACPACSLRAGIEAYSNSFVGLPMQQHGQQDAHSTASSKSGKRMRNKRTLSSRTHHTATTTPTASADGSSSLGPSSSSTATGAHRYGDLVRGEPDVGLGIVVGGMAGEGVQNQQEDRDAAGELTIDVIPTSSSKRYHAASVALRGTVDIEVRTRLTTKHGLRMLFRTAHLSLVGWQRRGYFLQGRLDEATRQTHDEIKTNKHATQSGVCNSMGPWRKMPPCNTGVRSVERGCVLIAFLI